MHVTADMSLLQLVSVLGIPLQVQQSARFHKCTSRQHKGISVTISFKNWEVMEILLTLCGLPYLQESSITYPSGYLLANTAVLRHFGWSPVTFFKKSVYFSWARTAAREKNWPTLPRTTGLIFAYQILLLFLIEPFIDLSITTAYNTWLGISFTWSFNGPIITEVPPDKNSTNFVERQAFHLIETHIPKWKSLINRHLQSI